MANFEPTMDMLITLSDRDLIEVGCALNGGKFGKDPARMNKRAKAAYILTLADPDVVQSVMANVRAGSTPAPAATAAEPPKPAAAPVFAPVDTPLSFDLTETPKPAAPARNGHSNGTAAATVHDPAAALADALRALVGNAATPVVDEGQVRAIVRDAVSEENEAQRDRITSNVSQVVASVETALRAEIAEVASRIGARTAVPLDLSGIGGAAHVEIEGTHPIFELVLRLIALPDEHRPNVMLVGPAGCGKSYMTRQIAQALSRAYHCEPLSAGKSEGAITARILPIYEGGRFGAVDSETLRLYEAGNSVIFFDEMDAADPNVLLAANAMTANGHTSVSERAVDNVRPVSVKRGDNVAILAACNTFGTGATSLYTGRGALDAATLDRWIIIEMGYDAALEARIAGVDAPADCGRWTPSAATDPESVRGDVAALHAWIREARTRAERAGLQRIVSTRMLQKAIALRMIGCSVAETKARLLAGWRTDELSVIDYKPEPWGSSVTADALDNAQSTATPAPDGLDCPDCGGPMIERVAGRGKNAGGKFYGCANFPRCRGTRPGVGL